MVASEALGIINHVHDIHELQPSLVLLIFRTSEMSFVQTQRGCCNKDRTLFRRGITLRRHFCTESQDCC